MAMCPYFNNVFIELRLWSVSFFAISSISCPSVSAVHEKMLSGFQSPRLVSDLIPFAMITYISISIAKILQVESRDK